MANFNSIKQEIDQNVNTNGQQLITGAILNETLKDMIDEVDSKKQDTLVAGSGINISGNVISATGGSGQTLSANPPLDINNDTIILNYGTGIKIGEGEALEADFDYVQEKLDSGVNIKTINGNSLLGSGDITISGGNGLWQSGSGTDSLVAPVSANAGLTASGDGALIAARGDSSATGRTSASFGLDNKATGDNSFAAGNHNEARGANSTVIGHGLYARNTDEVALGQYNSSHVSTSGQPWATKFSIGNGNSFINPSNVVEVRDNGKVFVNGIGGYAGSSSDNASNSLQEVVNGKQDTLVSGQNIKTINGNTILGSGDLVISGGQTYTAGDFINITSGVISVDSNNLAGNGLTTDSNGALEVDSSVVATQADLSGYLRNDDSGTIQNQDGTGDTSLTIIDGDSEDYVKLVAYDTPGVSPHIEIFENGSGDTKIYYDKIHSGNYDLNFPTLTQDETIATVSDLNTATSGLQPSLMAGNAIDASDLTNNDTISVNPTDLAGYGLYVDGNNQLSVQNDVFQEILSAGDGIEIDANNEISVKAGTGLGFDANGYLINTGGGGGTTYTAGDGIDITNGTISVSLDPYTGLDFTSGDLTIDRPQLITNLAGNGLEADSNLQMQVKLGSGLQFDANGAIETTGGGGSGLWSSGTGTNSLLSPSAVASSATASGTGALNAGYYNGQSGSASFANGDYSANFGTNNKVSYANSFASGLSNTTGGHEAFVGGGASNLAGGDCSAVIGGTFGTASGDNSVVIASGANGTANGNHSVAIGNATASGYGAIAIGEESSTNANHAIAIAGAEATGVNSVAIGKKVGTNNENEIGLGFANKVYTSGTGSIKSAFTVGNGTFSNGNYTYSNGLELKGNSDFYVYGVGGFDGTNSYNGNNSGNRAKTLQEVLNDKQDTLTAGTGISISGNVISATGGSGLWTSGTGTNSLVGPDGGTASGSGSISLNGSATATNSTSMAGGWRSSATGWNGFAYGNQASAGGDASISLGDHTNANIACGIALGQYAQTGNKQQGSIALGKYNYVDTGNTATQNTTFSIGNGTGNNARSNALELTAGDKFYMTGVGSYTGANASSATSVQDVINGKQDTLTAGTGISISGNVISATGGGGGNYLPLTGGTIQYDDPSSSDTDLSIISPNSASSIFFNAHEDDPGNTNEGYATMTITDEDANGNSHTAVYTSTGITDGNYTIAFPTLSGDDTFALLSDIQGGGFSAGSGIDITGSTISVDETYLDSVYLPILGGTLENTQNHTDLKIAAPHLESTAYADIMVNATTGTPYIELFSETSVSDDAESFKINGLGNFELEYVNGTSDIIELPHSAGTIALTNQLKWAPGTGNNSMVSAGGVASGLATATNTGSISAGYDTDATGLYSAAFGGQALASGDYSFAASNGSASGDYSASFGTSGSSADYAFSAGNGSTAAAISSIALGRGVHTTSGNTGEGALGIYNYSEAGLVFSIGCGTADNARENAVAIDASGKIFIKGVGGYTGTSTTGATDLATFLNSL